MKVVETVLVVVVLEDGTTVVVVVLFVRDINQIFVVERRSSAGGAPAVTMATDGERVLDDSGR